jgi:DNA-directed RNA polymerase subunit RPC12/RpoP
MDRKGVRIMSCWNCGAPVNHQSPRCPQCHRGMIMKEKTWMDILTGKVRKEIE